MIQLLRLTLLSLTSTTWATCSTNNNLLQVGTYAFGGDCDSQTYCASNGTCLMRGCRHDDFPFGYPQGGDFPSKCQRGQFCPDEMDACQDLLPIGSPCQFNRDDQCQAPPNFKELADTTGHGTNVNGSVCLKNVCMWANVTQGETCVFENTAYIAYGSDGEFPYIVSRGNCRVGLYCDAQDAKCKPEKAVGESCDADKECQSANCLSTSVCGDVAQAPDKIGTWVYAVVGVAIFGSLFGVLFGLFFVHRKQRDTEREKRMQYWREQNAFHQNLQQMREAARASILSLPNNGNSARSSYITDESHAGLLHNAQQPKGSSLRYDDSYGGSDEYDYTQPRREDPGRF
ncbi:hypothetical protein DL96DRAFT_1602678 [Flagelloscypha sp. PMI_526]|nr:hypothetical protein DL96DRAFT_1602678 [Flagelloscypha sp. PMI_526]